MYRFLKAVDTFLASLTPPVLLNELLPVLSRVPYPNYRGPQPPSHAKKASSVKGWVALYTMVTFRPDMSYREAQERAAQQSRVLWLAGWTCLGTV
ncbi:kynurenine 3-monooxygenase, mitochondrial precursor, partial [Tulasnella sp. 403]